MPTQTKFAPFDIGNGAVVGYPTTVTKNLQQFDPALGTLNFIEFWWESEASYKRRAENLSAGSLNAMWSPDRDRMGMRATTTVPGTGFMLQEYIGPMWPGLIVPLAAYDGVTNYQGASGTGAQTPLLANQHLTWPFSTQQFGIFPPISERMQNALFIGTGACQVRIDFLDLAVNNHQAGVLQIADEKIIYGALACRYNYS